MSLARDEREDMAIGGRPDALRDLSGPGVGILARRFGRLAPEFAIRRRAVARARS